LKAEIDVAEPRTSTREVLARRLAMSAYVIAALNVSDPDGYQVYKEMVPPTIADHGGTYLARGGRFEVLEGDSDLNRIVLLKYDAHA
jgi:uncharacterized protein (DUF1330 family)